MKIGDIIKAYGTGFHRLESIEDRSKNTGVYKCDSPLFRYAQVFDAKGKSRNGGRKGACDALFCMPAAQHIEKLIKEYEDTIKGLRGIKNSL